MKKLLVVFTLALLLFFGCTNNELESIKNDSDSLLSLKSKLTSLAISNIEEMVNIDPCNKNNPYDSWGEAVYIGFVKATQVKSESDLFVSEKFKKLFMAEVPKEFQVMNIEDVNLEIVNSLSKEFLSLFIHRNFIESIYLSKKMEAVVIESETINEADKAYLLKFVSLLRHFSYLSSTFTIPSKGLDPDRTFEQCWIDGLQALEDSGIVAQVSCAFTWPACFAVILADCALEQIGVQ